MLRLSFLFCFMFLLSNLIQGQRKLNFDPPTNVRYGQDHLPSQVDVMWTPPEGWEPSPVDKWIDWDLGLWDGNSLNCTGYWWDALHISFVGTPEMIRLKGLKVYPNPAKDQIRVESTEGKIMSVSVITIEGEVVLYRSFNDENILLDISCLPSSLYILQTITENGTSASKLMISKQ